MTEETNEQWKLARANIGRLRNSFYVTIEGFKSFNDFGHLAIDDIDFSSKSKIYC